MELPFTIYYHLLWDGEESLSVTHDGKTQEKQLICWDAT